MEKNSVLREDQLMDKTMEIEEAMAAYESKFFDIFNLAEKEDAKAVGEEDSVKKIR